MTATIYTIILGVVSLLTFALYAIDKKRAKNNAWRIPESTLLCFSLLGGGVGGYFAMHLVRHKTKHWYFHAVNLFGIIWQAALLIFFIVKT